MTTKGAVIETLREYIAKGYPIHFPEPEGSGHEGGVIVRHEFKEKDKGQQAPGES